ncbi:hypothetical protein PV325_003391, partial [Microctonus aethiopoides]
RYLPVLKNFPTRYIHEPWMAPLTIQRSAKCIIGRDYSLPMVNHSKSSRINIERMKQVYQQLSKYRGNRLMRIIRQTSKACNEQEETTEKKEDSYTLISEQKMITNDEVDASASNQE